MCGIAGYLIPDAMDTHSDLLVKMTRLLRHRGPDDEGFTLIQRRTGQRLDCSGMESDPRIRTVLPAAETCSEGFPHDVALSHRRFSIVDLSPAGHQPMWSTDGSVCLSFNGELYNYVELRRELEGLGLSFATQSDTEVLINAYRQWGTAAFSRFNGFWAIALYDARKGDLLLSRDRIGKAPLYYAVANNRLFWASEIKAILGVCRPGAFPVRGQAVDDYIVHGLRDFDGTFWQGIYDFPPACFATVAPDLSLKIHYFWSLPERRTSVAHLNPEDAALQLRTLLSDATRLRIRADVPVAFELSGGMDSSSLVGLAASSHLSHLPAYTVAFDEEDANEVRFAKDVVQFHAGKIDHNILKPLKADFWTEADTFVHTQEEPFHSPNLQTNQMLRRQICCNGIRVVIAGSAGDEVLAGYASEYFAPFLWHLFERLRFRELAREIRDNSEYNWLRGAISLSKLAIGNSFAWTRRFSPQRSRIGRTIRILRGVYLKPSDSVNREPKPDTFDERMKANMGRWQMNYWVRSGNKANFGIPIEARVPFLDYRVVEFAFSLPPEYLIQDGWHKWILRRALDGILPPSVIWRKVKMGFPFPYREWLAFSKSSARINLQDIECPYLNVRELMNRYNSLVQEDPVLLWRLVCLGLWWRKMIERRPIESAFQSA